MMGGYGFGYGFNGLNWLAMVIGMLINFLIPILPIVLIGYFLLRRQTIANGQGNTDSSLEILKQRYAKGEITSEEFRSMREDLKK